MSTADPPTLYRQLLRPPILHILRAVGFTRTRPAVLETLLDLTSRYLTLLAYQTARHASLHESADETSPVSTPSVTITDIRMALQDVGALHPSVGELEEQLRGDGTGEEDMRGIDNFISWCHGDLNAEIRRVAGMNMGSEMRSAGPSAVTSTAAAAAAVTTATAMKSGGLSNAASGPQLQDYHHPRGNISLNTTSDPSSDNTTMAALAAAAVAGPGAESDPALLMGDEQLTLPEDYLSILKKKHSKTGVGEESRWQGTILGREAPVGYGQTQEQEQEHERGQGDIVIEGWDLVGNLNGWGKWVRDTQGGGDGQAGEAKKGPWGNDVDDEGDGGAIGGGSESSSPLSDIGGSGSGSGSGSGGEDDGFG